MRGSGSPSDLKTLSRAAGLAKVAIMVCLMYHDTLLATEFDGIKEELPVYFLSTSDSEIQYMVKNAFKEMFRVKVRSGSN